MKGEQLCAGHLGYGVGAGGDYARAQQQLGAQRRTEAAEHRKMSLKARLAMGLERRAEEIEARLGDIITHGSDADALRAIEAWLSRVHGRPTEHTVVEAPEPESLQELRRMSSAERRALLARLDTGDGLAQVLPLHAEKA